MTGESNVLQSVVNDMLVNCGHVQAGQNVLIVAALDGLAGGHNIVDRETVDLIFNGAQRLKARPSVLWLDMTQDYAADKISVPPILEHAIKGTDIVVCLVQDLSWEENSHFRDILRANKVPVIRQMATTIGMLSSPWGQLPYEIVAQIRYATGSMMKEGGKFSITHENGTNIEGTIALPPNSSSFRSFTQWRKTDLYRPFPEGVYVPMTAGTVDGQLVFDSLMPVAADYIGLPFRFSRGIKLTVKDRFVQRIEGGPEAKALEKFLVAASKEFGDEVYQASGFHGGVHPYATLSPDSCRSEGYREFVEHHHISSVHFHLAGSVQRQDIHQRLQLTCEVRGTTFKVDGKYILTNGKPAALRDPGVLEVASRYMHIPCVRNLFVGAPYTSLN